MSTISLRVKLLMALVALFVQAFALSAATPIMTGPIQKQDRVLWVVTAGVSLHQDAKQNPGVAFAAKDARDAGAAMKIQEGKLYGKVVHIHLENQNATRNNILQSIAGLQGKVQPWDTVVVYLAGHGGKDVQNRYFFVPHDFNGANPGTAVYGAEIRRAMQSLPGTQMLILDTCHSSQLAHENRDTSIITLAACLPTEGSVELPNLQNGIFTRALVEAMSGLADVNKDGVVTLAEVDAYVCNRVTKLNPQQNPNVFRPATVAGNFQVAQVGGGNAMPATNVASNVTIPAANFTTGPVTTGPATAVNTGVVFTPGSAH